MRLTYRKDFSMPRDKTNTHHKLLPCIKKEFLEHGYEKASLQNIARCAGITAAGLYRHFQSKEAMFTAMVEPTTSDFLKICNVSMEETYSRLSDNDFLQNFNEFRTEKNRETINYMYDNYDVFRLLLACSKGTPYESFQEKLVEIEMKGVIDLFHVLDKRGLSHKIVTDNELHILCTTFVTALCETIKHEYSREQALKHLDFIGQMLYPGMKEVLGF